MAYLLKKFKCGKGNSELMLCKRFDAYTEDWEYFYLIRKNGRIYAC